MSKPNLTAERLRELFHYDPETGMFWKRKSNAMCGHTHRRGYVIISIDGYGFAAHRLAWLYVHGTHPSDEIDHINGNRADNKISNLRDVSHAVNAQNRRAVSRNNKYSEYLGVSRRGNRWAARIIVDNKERFIGSFATQEIARDAYLTAKRQLHEGCTI